MTVKDAVERVEQMSTRRERGWARPVAVPPPLSALAGAKGGRVSLPLSVYSSGRGESRSFDPDDEGQRIAAYELLITEATVEDQARLLDAEHLRRL